MHIHSEDVKAYIQINSASIRSAEDVSLRFGIPMETFRKKIRCLDSMPLGKYIRHCKLERIKDLLRETNLSCAEIAWQSGLGQSQNVARAFKREFGISMISWRQLHGTHHESHNTKNDKELSLTLSARSCNIKVFH